MNILVLCTGNSARSIILEALLNGMGRKRVRAWSAGSKPTGQVHPQSRVLLKNHGFAITDARSKSWDEFAGPGAPEMNMVITVCGSAAGETCPIWPGAPIRAHWGVEDPAAAAEADQTAAFETAYRVLRCRAQALLDLPFETMHHDKLRSALADIGKLAN